MSEPKHVYTIEDLRNWESVTGDLESPARLGVFGDPVEHSLSPQMHQPALDEAGLDLSYVRLHIAPEDFEEALKLVQEAGFVGANFTIPHKQAAFAAASDRTEIAERIGMVNTLLFEDGEIIGHNTDAPGLKQAIRDAFTLDLRDLRVLVLGAGGGAGRAAAMQCAFDQCERLVLANRTVEKARSLADELADLYAKNDRLEGPASRLSVVGLEEEALEDELEQIDLIINATSSGMKRSDPALIPPRLLQPHHLIYDMIYKPPRTRLMVDAEAVGARAENGLGMLLWQGALAFEFWFSQKPSLATMRQGIGL